MRRTGVLEELERVAAEVGGNDLVVREIPLAEIAVDPEQPRRDFSGETVRPRDREALESLAANVKALGVDQPVRVRTRPDGDGYVLVTGERRYRAARLAGLPTLPCLLDAGADEDPGRRTLRQLSENLQRSDLGLLDIAQALQRLLAAGLKRAEVAATLGKSKSWVSQHLAALKATSEGRKALEAGLVTSIETLRLFDKLPRDARGSLVREAVASSEKIGRAGVRRLLERAERRVQEREANSGGASEDEADPAPPRAPKSPVYAVRLTASDLAVLIRALGGEVPRKPRARLPKLLELLSRRHGTESPLASTGRRRVVDQNAPG